MATIKCPECGSKDIRFYMEVLHYLDHDSGLAEPHEDVYRPIDVKALPNDLEASCMACDHDFVINGTLSKFTHELPYKDLPKIHAKACELLSMLPNTETGFSVYVFRGLKDLVTCIEVRQRGEDAPINQ